MSIIVIRTFPSFPQSIQTIEIAGTRYRMQFTYRARCRSWYISLYDANSLPLAEGKRLSPRWDPLFGLLATLEIPGFFYVRGVDEYTQTDLGGALQLWFIPAEDLLVVNPVLPDANAPTITIA